MKKNCLFSMVMAAMLFAGCGSSRMILNNVSTPDGIIKVNLYIPPHEALCLKVTGAMMKKDGTRVINEIFPSILFGGEYFPARIKWNTWTVTSDRKYELPGQSIISGLNPDAYFTDVNIIDGNIPGIEDARTVRISSMGRFVYDSEANECPIEDWSKFQNDTNGYRKDLVLKCGSRVGDRRPAAKFFQEANKWTRFRNANGKFLCPLGREQEEYLKTVYPQLTKEGMREIQEKNLQEVAGINPQYSRSEKLLGSNPTLYLSPVATLTDVAIKILEVYSGRVPSLGFDFDSQVNRREMALSFEYSSAVLRAYVRQLNMINLDLLEKIEKMEKKSNGKVNAEK